MKTQNGNPQEEVKETTQTSAAIYTIIPRSRKTDINPGEKLEIELFLSGYGHPKKNKLHIQWSSPYVVDQDKVGNIVLYRIGEPEIVDGKVNVLRMESEVPSVGATLRLDRLYFLQAGGQVPECGLPNVAAEGIWAGEGIGEPAIPIFVSLNTVKDARPRDYSIAFTFTYGDMGDLRQEHEVVPFHVRTKWEKSQRWAIPRTIAAVSIAFISLIITAVGTLRQIFGW